MNIKNKYRIKDPIFALPHNYLFADACNMGMVIDFLYKNFNADPKDYTGEFIQETKKIVDKIAELAKIRE